jgi:selenocysteine lyase/cysteine desulfurase
LQDLSEGLAEMPGVRLWAAEDPATQTGVLSLQLADADCETLAEALGEGGIAVRAGLHCAPLAHQSAGTADAGTVRLSISAFNTRREVEAFLGIFAQVAKKLR